MTTTATKDLCFIVSAADDVSPKLIEKVLLWLRSKSGYKSVPLNRDDSLKGLSDDTRILLVIDTLPTALGVAKNVKKSFGEPVIIRLGAGRGAGDKDNVYVLDVPKPLTDKTEFPLFRELSRIWRESHPRAGHVERPRPKLPWEN